MNDTIKSIQENKLYSWCFAFLLGVFYRYGYGVAKDMIWANRKLNFITEIVDPNSKTQLFFLTVGVNFTVDFSSALLPALICGAVLIYIFQTKARLFSLAAVIPFLAFSRRAWHFWEAPDPGLQISVLLTPTLGVLVLFAVIFIKTKKMKTAEQMARPDGG